MPIEQNNIAERHARIDLIMTSFRAARDRRLARVVEHERTLREITQAIGRRFYTPIRATGTTLN